MLFINVAEPVEGSSTSLNFTAEINNDSWSGGSTVQRDWLELVVERDILDVERDILAFAGDTASVILKYLFVPTEVRRKEYSDSKVANRNGRVFGFPSTRWNTVLRATRTTSVWDLSIVEGAFSVAPCQTLALRFAFFPSLYRGGILIEPSRDASAPTDVSTPHAPLQASPFDEQVPPSRVPYRVSIPVWSSLDGQLQPIEVLMEVVPDVISDLSRVDTAIGPLNATVGVGLDSNSSAFESSPGTSVSGTDVPFFVYALDQFGNALDSVEKIAVDIFRIDTARQERETGFTVPPLTIHGGFPGLLQGTYHLPHCH
jgi:hypothetical protein